MYRVVPKDETKQTWTGTLASITSISIILYLFYTELILHLSVQTKMHMFIGDSDEVHDENPHQEFLIHLDISTPAIPCALLSLDSQDVMGHHDMDVHGTDTLIKTRIDRDTLEALTLSDGGPLPTEDVPIKEFKGEGCRIAGVLRAKKVPGNFHLSAHAHRDYLHLLTDNGVLNTTHVINAIRFGEMAEAFADIEEAKIDVLAGHRKMVSEGDNDGRTFEYYMKVVPTWLRKLDGTLAQSYQYTWNGADNDHYQLPAIYFRYDYEPITVLFEEKKNPVYRFVVQVSAIIGGVFTVFGLLSGVLAQVASYISPELNTVKKKTIGTN